MSHKTTGRLEGCSEGAEQWYRVAKPGQPRTVSAHRVGGGEGLLLEPQVLQTLLTYGVTQGHRPGPWRSGKARQLGVILASIFSAAEIWAEEV